MGSEWIAVFAPLGLPLENDPLRGSWFLYVPPWEIEPVWADISFRTKNGDLGYRSSRSESPMFGGSHVGYYTICCFILDEKKNELKFVLEEIGHGEYIHHYDLIHKFRNRVKYEDETGSDESSVKSEEESESEDTDSYD